MVKVEVCIATDDIAVMRQDVLAAHEGGAATIELCSRMDVGGLTPSPEAMLAARKAFPRAGMMVMIRPRPGDFQYSERDIDAMQKMIHTAAAADADGVVLGILTADRTLAKDELARMATLADSLDMQVSLHRAFDDALQPMTALQTCIDLGMARVLTAGSAYRDDLPAVEGKSSLHALIREAENRIEIVIGGGVNPENAARILRGAPPTERLSLHAFSGVRMRGKVQVKRVQALYQAANPHP